MSEINEADQPLPHPPRIQTENRTPEALQGNLISLTNYITRIYKKLELEGRFATTSSTAGLPADFEEGETVDPTEATITTAQTTANSALTLAAALDAKLDAIKDLGVLTQAITNPPTQAEVENIQDKVNAIISAVS